MKKKYKFFDIKRGSWIHIRKILFNTLLITLERTMYLATVLLLARYRCQSTDLMVSIMLKYDSKIKVNRQQININVYVRCFAIIVLQEIIWILFETLTCLWIDLYFLCECFLYLSVINFTPIIRVQGFSNRDTIIGHVNMNLVKTNWEKNWHVSCLAEEKETFLRWFSSSV